MKKRQTSIFFIVNGVIIMLIRRFNVCGPTYLELNILAKKD